MSNKHFEETEQSKMFENSYFKERNIEYLEQLSNIFTFWILPRKLKTILPVL